MNTKKTFLFLIFCILNIGAKNCYAQGNSLVINEIMQSNVNSLFVDYDFPDSWVELYNPTDNEINIKKMRIGLSEDVAESYTITVDSIIAPQGHVVIYCDKVGNGLHTNFRIDSGKGMVCLFDKKGTLIDKLTHKKMKAIDIAYGRTVDGGDTWQYELIPTPGTTNGGGGSDLLLPQPVFDIEGQLCNSPLTINITMPEGDFPDDTRIYMTLNGEEPSLNSASGTSFSIYIDTSTVVRAKLISQEALFSSTLTQSYIFPGEHGVHPIVSLVLDSAYLFNSEYGILSPDSADGSKPNYQQSWRRPVNVEYFDANGMRIFNQIGETAVGGNYSRKFAQKSLKVYANKRFGTKRFNATFWPEKPNVTAVKSFVLRNGGNRCEDFRIEDAFIQRVIGSYIDSIDYQAYSPCVCYINGDYKGIYGLRERSNEDYVEANYGIDDDSIICVGLMANTRLERIYQKEDITYSEIADKIDVFNLVNYLIAEVFATNWDWPSNNVSLWKPLSQEGKWKWILKDMDAVYDRKGITNFLDYLFLNGEEGDKVISSPRKARHHQFPIVMIGFPEYRKLFVEKFSVYLGDFLKPAITIPLLKTMGDEILDEIIPTHEAWGRPASLYNKYISRLEYVKGYLKKRPMETYQEMAGFFDLGYVFSLKVNTESEQTFLNDVELKAGDFDGAYYSNYPLRLKSSYSDKIWEMTIFYSDLSTLKYNLQSDDVSIDFSEYTAIGDIDRVEINKIDYEGTTVSLFDFSDNLNKVVAVYSPSGVKRKGIEKGLNIVIYSNGDVRKFVQKSPNMQ